jgi:hypothetical protein
LETDGFVSLLSQSSSELPHGNALVSGLFNPTKKVL